MLKGNEEKRKAYMAYMYATYGIKIEEFRLSNQHCGYFHVTFPIFMLGQEPGSEPIAFYEPVTEYMECNVKNLVRKKLSDSWYEQMCMAWRSNHAEEPQELTHIERGKNSWED